MELPLADAHLLLVFGSTQVMATLDVDGLRRAYPAAIFFGCSTAGEIAQTQITDETLVLTAVRFSKTRIRGHSLSLSDFRSSDAAGRTLGERLKDRDLRHVIVLSDGLRVNGSELVAGLTGALGPDIPVTGGLSADGDRFHRTLVMMDAPPEQGIVAAVGLYGNGISVGHGSFGGWDAFGTDRIITRSQGNVLYELDGVSALDLYKRYLGDYAAQLPSSALLFPLHVRKSADDPGMVRTILGVDETARSMTFAGDMPVGSRARLMKANFDRLIDGAAEAAKVNARSLRGTTAELALLVSCVGRRLVLKQRAEEELDAVRETLGRTPVLCGFYSYGEISPLHPGAACNLHNQTMSITTLCEA